MHESGQMIVAEAGDGGISRWEVHGKSMPAELQGRARAEVLGETGALER